jgi:hypothetical protein
MVMLDSHTLTVASLVFGVLGSLYLSYDLLGRREGFLRRLTVAIPSAILFAIYYQFLDVQSGNIISNTLSDVLQYPVPTYGVLVLAAIVGSLPYLFAPTLQTAGDVRDLNAWQKSLAESSLFLLVVSGLVSMILAAVTSGLLFQILSVSTGVGNMVGGPPRLGLYVGVGVGLVLAFTAMLANIRVHNSYNPLDETPGITASGCFLGVFGCLLAIVWLAAGIYFLIRYPVPTLIFGVSSSIMLGIIGLIQRWANSLPDRRLGSIGAALTLVAFAVQLFLELAK